MFPLGEEFACRRIEPRAKLPELERPDKAAVIGRVAQISGQPAGLDFAN
jgi:hypothetical protein